MFQASLGLFLTVFASTAFASPSVFAHTNDTTATCPYTTRDLVAARAASVIDFSNSEWIYTNEITSAAAGAPIGSRALCKTFVAPQGKTPEYATIIFAVDDEAAFFVNENQIAVNQFYDYGTYCVKLTSCLNVFAVNVTNFIGRSGFLFAAQIMYTDGTTSNIVSDATWHAYPGSIPSGFQLLSFDDNSWPAAFSQGLASTGPWARVPVAGVDDLSFNDARWIWTDELSGGNAPPGARAFRKTIFLPEGHTTASATVIIIVDDEYSLYANGVFVGTGTNWQIPQRYVITNIQGPKVVFAIYAVNANTVVNPAGILASFEITSKDPSFSCVNNCTSTTFFGSDSYWKSNHGVPTGFQLPDFDDSAWSIAVEEGVNGISPWGTIAVPTTGSPLSGAPDLFPVPQ